MFGPFVRTPIITDGYMYFVIGRGAEFNDQDVCKIESVTNFEKTISVPVREVIKIL